MLQAMHEDPGFSTLSPYPVLVCLLGRFCLLKLGHTITVPCGGKTEALLTVLALRYPQPVARETLRTLLWPDHPPELATQSLNSLVYSLRRQFSAALNGAALLLHVDGHYGLNHPAGVGTDLVWFETLVQHGDQLRTSDPGAAVGAYQQALELYRGDLATGTDVYAAVEREHLRARFLTVLACLADYYYTRGEYQICLTYAHRLLAHDPCREDAHRLLMHCYMHAGQRTQALRQYHFCAEMLRAEFEAAPELRTMALYEQIRTNPGDL